MKVSVIIPTYKRVEQTKKTVEAVLKSAKDVSQVKEIIVTDNTPDSSLQDMLTATFGTQVHYTKAPIRGLGANKNHGIRVATGDVLIFCDSDIEVTQDAIGNTVAALATHRAAGGVGATVLWRGGEKDGTQDRPQGTDRKMTIDGTTYIEVLYGRYFGTYKKVLEDVGLYDEVVFNFLGESSDMSTRLWRAGYPLIYDASIVVHHMHDAPESLATRIEHPEYTIIRNWLLLMYRFTMFDGENDHFKEHVTRYLDTLGDDRYMAFFQGMGKYAEDIAKSIEYLQQQEKTKEVYAFGFLEVFSNEALVRDCIATAEERLRSISRK